MANGEPQWWYSEITPNIQREVVMTYTVANAETVAALTQRLAAVTALARELAAGVHQDALHAPDWSVCDMQPCVRYRAVIEGDERSV